jgi:hypothetical protein
MLTYTPPSSSALSWGQQLQMLRSALLHDPTNPLAWRWRVRAKVLTYMVSRYGEAGNLQLATSEPVIGRASEVKILPYAARPLPSPETIRKMLDEIAGINHALIR